MMKKIKFEILIYWNSEDKRYLAEVPELPGCMADGDTYEKALKNVRVIIRDWIKTARNEGRQVPRPKGRRLVFA